MRYNLPSEPQAAGYYLAARVDDEWFWLMVEAYEDAHDAILAKEFHEAYERGEIETVPWEEVKAELRKKGKL